MRNNAVLLAGIFVIFIGIGYLAQELDLTATLINFNLSDKIADAQEGSSIWSVVKNTISNLLGPIIWVINSAASFIQLVTFSADIPPLANALIVAPLGFMVLYLTLKLARG